MIEMKRYIFENEHETLFETDICTEMRDYVNDFQENHDKLIFQYIYESMNYITIHFVGYNLMITKW